MNFEELGDVIWKAVRRKDAVAKEILGYYAAQPQDKAVCVMSLDLEKRFGEDIIEGAYHALCGLGFLEPFIDNEGCECARLTKDGIAIYQRLVEVGA